MGGQWMATGKELETVRQCLWILVLVLINDEVCEVVQVR